MKIIQSDGYSKLVEDIDNEGNYQRYILPIEEDDIRFGIPYGVPFEKFVEHPAISNEFRRRGLWTIKDLEQNRNAALGAIQAAYAQDLATIIKLAKKEEVKNG